MATFEEWTQSWAAAVAVLAGVCGFLWAAYVYATSTQWAELGVFGVVVGVFVFLGCSFGVGFLGLIAGWLIGSVLGFILWPLRRFTAKH